MPKKVDHSQRRESIAKAAFAVIARDGIAGATLRAVAEEAGTSSALLMHYIASLNGARLHLAARCRQPVI
jgi:AcrR family transcriptional regulator